MAYILRTTTDQSGAIYQDDTMATIGEYESMRLAMAALKQNLIPGVRGPGCFDITDPDGRSWVSDPRGVIGDESGMVRMTESGEIVDQWP